MATLQQLEKQLKEKRVESFKLELLIRHIKKGDFLTTDEIEQHQKNMYGKIEEFQTKEFQK